MADIEKVIKGLERCSSIDMCYMEISCYHPKCFECHYHEESECIKHLVKDALELLTAVKPKQEKAILDYQSWHYVCGDCEKPIDIQDNFCRHFGRPIEHP